MSIQWALVIFTALTGLAGWTFVFTGLNEFLKKSETSGFIPGLVSLILLAAGGIASACHLSHVERMMGALAHPGSGIFTEAVLVALLGVSIIVYLICVKRGAKGGIKVCAGLGIVFGILISFLAGYSYIMSNRAAWDTFLLPCCYLATAIPMGAALYGALACKDEGSQTFAALMTTIGGGISLVVVLAYTISGGAFAGEGLPWACVAILFSGVATLVCGLAGKKKPSANLAWIAACCGLVGAVAYRAMMWVIGTGFYNFFGN